MKTIVLLIILFLLTSCSAYQKFGTDIDSVFLEDRDLSQKLENLPFAHSWVEDQSQAETYRSIVIGDFRSDLIESKEWTNSASAIINSASDYQKETEAIAAYFREQFMEKLKSFPNGRYKVLDVAEPDSIFMELALTKIEFSHPGSNAASMFSPIPGTGAALSAISEPHIAFAAAFTDPNQHYKLLATVADKRFPPVRLIDFNKFTITSSVREIVSAWATELATAIQSGQFSRVDGPDRFSLKPW